MHINDKFLFLLEYEPVFEESFFERAFNQAFYMLSKKIGFNYIIIEL